MASLNFIHPWREREAAWLGGREIQPRRNNGNVRQAYGLVGCGASGTGNAGDAEADIGLQNPAGAARHL